MNDTLFDVLGLLANANDIQIGDAYRRLKAGLAHDPDRLRQVEEAYRVLANPISRQRYLQSLSAEPRAEASKPQAAQPSAPPDEARRASRPTTEIIETDSGNQPPARGERQPTQVLETESKPDETRLNPLHNAAGAQTPPAPILQVSYQDHIDVYELRAGHNWIGRPSKNAQDLSVPLPDDDRFISRQHARIFVDGATWTITDNSENGTLLNEKPLRHGQPMRLKDGDVIIIEGRRLTIRKALPAAAR